LRDQRIGLRLTPERSTGKTLAVPNVLEDSSFGFGVRVIVNGAWGFASSPLVTPEEIARITGEATIIAKANAAIQPKPVQLAAVKPYRDRVGHAARQESAGRFDDGKAGPADDASPKR
jgi:TldD protein